MGMVGTVMAPEAASQIPKSIRDGRPEIPWVPIIGLRNRLVHVYAAVNLDVVWRIVQEDLPPLIVGLRKALEE